MNLPIRSRLEILTRSRSVALHLKKGRNLRGMDALGRGGPKEPLIKCEGNPSGLKPRKSCSLYVRSEARTLLNRDFIRVSLTPTHSLAGCSEGAVGFSERGIYASTRAFSLDLLPFEVPSRWLFLKGRATQLPAFCKHQHRKCCNYHAGSDHGLFRACDSCVMLMCGVTSAFAHDKIKTVAATAENAPSFGKDNRGTFISRNPFASSR